ncbi:renalase [Trichonephila clavata]|uniref:Renalase n=1 Tax=Trichonephila clavata TaxID=2740835 RepID=A0A8X6ILI9_TRICU|nr:renalase [Trichonephila clavata]
MSEKTLISKILIVGGGMTGSVTASLIKHEAFVNIEIWEKMNQIGGRYQTYRSSSIPTCSVDCGAQYVNVSLELVRSQARFYDELLEKSLLVPLGPKVENFRKLSESKTIFVAPGGTDSLVHHFLDKADCEVHLNHNVEEINLLEDKKLWEVKSSSGEVKEFDVVILTIPVPEVLKLSGNFLSLSQDDDIKVAMEQVKYAPRFAIALLYNGPVPYLEELPAPMKFFDDDKMLHFMSIDNQKRVKKSDVPAVIIQSTSTFATSCADKSEDEIKSLMMEHIKYLMPDLPEPVDVKLFQWTYSKLIEPYIDTPGCIVLNSHPCFLSGGDSYTESSFNGCITSSLKIVEELLKHVNFIKGRRRNSRRTS